MSLETKYLIMHLGRTTACQFSTERQTMKKTPLAGQYLITHAEAQRRRDFSVNSVLSVA